MKRAANFPSMAAKIPSRAPSISARFPTATSYPPTVPVTPFPGIVVTFSARPMATRRSSAAATIAAASGCSLARSTPATMPRTRFSSKPGSVSIATTFGFPSVSVPVLSTRSVSMLARSSSASALRIRIPAVAPQMLRPWYGKMKKLRRRPALSRSTRWWLRGSRIKESGTSKASATSKGSIASGYGGSIIPTTGVISKPVPVR